MGRDKATLLVDGSPMAARVAAAARAAGAEAVAGVGPPVEGCEPVPDDHPGAGPLGGLLTALRWAGGRPVVVLACDLLAPSPAAVARVVAAWPLPPAAPADAVVPVVGGRDQWLHAGWWPGARHALDEAFAAGERSIHRAATGIVVHRYDEPDGPALADADTEGDLARDDE
jgi:molybdopterin-guanine dinucleotide biosynthesis protein A